MSVQYITWQEAKRMCSERLRAWIEQMPVYERGLKILWGQRLLSPLDMLRSVELLDSLGREIISAELAKLSQEVGVQYVITG